MRREVAGPPKSGHLFLSAEAPALLKIQRQLGPTCGSASRLETEAERELYGARAADLIERAEAAVDAAGAEAARERLRAQAEEAAAEVAHGVAEVRVVEDVENLGTQLQARVFGERELPPHREVELRQAEAAQGVAPERALPTRDDPERRGVEAPPARRPRVFEVDGDAADEVGPPRLDEVADEDAGRLEHVDGRGGARAEDGVERPAAQERAAARARGRARQVVRDRGAQRVAHV